MCKALMSMELPKTCMRCDPTNEVRMPESCIVTYVNQEHGWYEVKFMDSGVKESYRSPSFNHSILKGTTYSTIPVACLETGLVYPSLRDCARDMNLSIAGLSLQVEGKQSHCNGYHFITVM